MITDKEQKLYRILFNYYSQHREMPSWELLQAKTGIAKAELNSRLQALSEAGYILWEDTTSTAKIAMNRDPFLKSTTAADPVHKGAEYFQNY